MTDDEEREKQPRNDSNGQFVTTDQKVQEILERNGMVPKDVK